MADWLALSSGSLNHVVFHRGADAVSWAEMLGFIIGAAPSMTSAATCRLGIPRPAR